MKIYDVTGKLVKNKYYNTLSSTTISMVDLKKGIYLLRGLVAQSVFYGNSMAVFKEVNIYYAHIKMGCKLFIGTKGIMAIVMYLTTVAALMALKHRVIWLPFTQTQAPMY